MVDKQITEFTEQTTSVKTDEFLIQNAAGQTRKMSAGNIKRDGYEDLMPTGEYSAPAGGAPTVKDFISPIRLPAFASGATNGATYRFHFHHDLVEGSDFYLHVHWFNANATPTGNVDWKITWRYAEGYELGDFGTEIITTLPSAPVNSTQYSHHITESDAITPAILGRDVKTDGMILAHLERLGSTDSNTDDAFLGELDIHYLSDGTLTVDKNQGAGWVKV